MSITEQVDHRSGLESLAPHSAKCAAPVAARRPQRKAVLLQGPAGPFWTELGAAMRRAGHEVRKVHFNLPDQLGWHGGGSRTYRGNFKDWEAWFESYLRVEQPSDILYYADRLPYHVTAAAVAERLGVRAWAFENGYLRPDWLTMEPIGMSRFSRFPKDPEAIRQLASRHPAPDLTIQHRHTFRAEALSEIAVGIGLVLGRPLFPAYFADRYYDPVIDYLSWGLRVLQKALTGHASRAVARRAVDGLEFSLLAMQLQSDYQIRASSDYGHLEEMLEEVVSSFARNAPPSRHLVVKSHPMDNGWENWPRRLRRIATCHGVSRRVHWLDGGDLVDLLDRARSLITVNSTVGLQAIRQDCPVIALGSAIYDVPGLTHQAGLDRFWVDPELADTDLSRAYVTAIATSIQVRGSFLDRAGREKSIKEVVQRIDKADEYWFG